MALRVWLRAAGQGIALEEEREGTRRKRAGSKGGCVCFLRPARCGERGGWVERPKRGRKSKWKETAKEEKQQGRCVRMLHT